MIGDDGLQNSNLSETVNEINLETSDIQSTIENTEEQNLINVAETAEIPTNQHVSCWQKFRHLKWKSHALIILTVLFVSLSIIAAFFGTMNSLDIPRSNDTNDNSLFPDISGNLTRKIGNYFMDFLLSF